MTFKAMSAKKAVFTTLVSILSVSSLFSVEAAVALPRVPASQIENWIKVGSASVGFGGVSYEAYNRYMKDGEVTRDFLNKNGQVLFSYTANCRDSRNVVRFWQHPNNGTITAILNRATSDNSRKQQLILALINRACRV